MASTEEHIRKLCQWPHRGTTTANEALGADYVAKTLEERGYHVVLEKFKAPNTALYRTYMLITGWAAMACLLAFRWPAAALGVALMPILYLLAEFYFCQPVHNIIFPGGSSTNVIGRVPNPDAKAKLILSAHIDSQLGSYLFSKDWGRLQPLMTNGATVGMVAAILISMVRLFGVDGAAVASLQVANVAFMLTFFVLLAVAEWTGGYVQGAGDDASGVATILALAEDLKNVPPDNLEVWILATGAEETGLCGMAHFMRKGLGKSLDKRSAWFINFDNLGAGDLVFLNGETIPGFKYPGEIVELARDVAADPHSPNAREGWWGVPTDALIPALRGFPSATIFAYDEKGMTPNYHYWTDTVDNVNFEVSEQARSFAFDLVRKIDQRLAGHFG